MFDRQTSFDQNQGFDDTFDSNQESFLGEARN